jgi:hypothetical protein
LSAGEYDRRVDDGVIGLQLRVGIEVKRTALGKATVKIDFIPGRLVDRAAVSVDEVTVNGGRIPRATANEQAVIGEDPVAVSEGRAGRRLVGTRIVEGRAGF